MIAFEGAEGALEVLLDLGAVAEEVFVDEVVGVAGDVLHADGEAEVGVGVGFRILGAFEAFGQLHLERPWSQARSVRARRCATQ